MIGYSYCNHRLQDTLHPVTSFKYLGGVLLALEDNWMEVVRNLRRLRYKWALLSSVLIREDADAPTSGIIYVAVVQVVLLYGSETWVMTPRIGRVLADSTTGWPADCQGGNLEEEGMVGGCIPFW